MRAQIYDDDKKNIKINPEDLITVSKLLSKLNFDNASNLIGEDGMTYDRIIGVLAYENGATEL
jgi:hypothetical protein